MAVCMQCETTVVDGVNRIITGPWPSAEFGSLVVLEGLLNLGSSIHDERAMLRHWLSDRGSLEQKDLGGFVRGTDLEIDVAANLYAGSATEPLTLDGQAGPDELIQHSGTRRGASGNCP